MWPNMQNFDALPAIMRQWRARLRTQQTSSKPMEVARAQPESEKGSLAETVVFHHLSVKCIPEGEVFLAKTSNAVQNPFSFIQPLLALDREVYKLAVVV